MRTKFIYSTLLCSLLALVSSCESNDVSGDVSALESPFASFEYVTSSGRTYIPDIDDAERTISIYGVEDSDGITGVNYELKPGVSILPDPASRVGDWRSTELFVVSVDDEKIPYVATLKDYKYATIETDAKLYTQQTYGSEVKYHLYDLKNDSASNQLDTYENAETMFQQYGLCGVRIPIWGATDTVTGEEGHPAEGEVNYNVYGRTYSRVSNALKAFMAGGKNKSDFIVFMSIKSSGSTQVKLPSWCFTNGVIARTNLLPDKYAVLIENLTSELKKYVDPDLQIQVIGLDNESSFANATDNSTTWMHYETVPYIKARFEANGWNTPQFISHEAWEPKTFSNGWYKSLLTSHPETVDIYGVHYYHDKDHPKYFGRLETEWDASMTDATYAHPDGVVREFWASEPHWLSMSADSGYDDDFFKVSEEAMCCLWAQSDLGMTAFSWWSFGVGTTLRNDLMRIASVPITGYTPIKFVDHDDGGFSKDDTTVDDVTRDYDLDSNNLKTRAFINGNNVTLYLLNVDWYANRATAPSYTDYKIGISDATLTGYKISYEQWVGEESGASNYTTTSGTFSYSSDQYFSIDIPARSITCLQFTITPNE
ncbi:MAG: DUF4971 domain-containing protein [Rikenellaceae bacterium]